MPDPVRFTDFILAAPLATSPLGAADRMVVVQDGETRGMIPSVLQAFVTAAPLTGDTIVLAANTTRLLLKPAGTLAALIVVTPPGPLKGNTLTISSSRTITVLTVDGEGASSVRGTARLLTGDGGGATWVYDDVDDTWYRG